MNFRRRSLAALLAATFLVGTIPVRGADAPADPLAAGFANPPRDAHPLVYWQWVNGNVSQEGIRRDLEWMARVGIAGAILFDIGFSRPPVPQYVADRVGFGTEAWRSAVRFAAAEARRLGLLLGAQSSGGWSVSGGPMVRPEQAMKKLVWSETLVTQDSPGPVRLADLPSVNGPYQDAAIDNTNYLAPGLSADVAVIAFLLPEAEQVAPPRAIYRDISNGSLLDDGSYARAVELHGDAQGQAIVEARLEFQPRSLTLGKAGRGALPAGVVESSVDGVNFSQVLDLPGAAAQPSPVITVALGERQEQFWRVRFTKLEAPLALTEARFEPGARVHRAQEKAGFGVLADYFASTTAPVPSSHTIDPDLVFDVTSKLAPEGMLDWRPPRAGRWIVLRLGWSLTGRRTVPANSESIGLEVDKLDAAAVGNFAEAFYGLHRGAIGDAGKLDIAFTDSWEAGQQNWTADMFGQFAKRRGYDLRRWAPALTGRVVASSSSTEAVLSDFRRTLAELIVENHYGVLAQAAHRHGMQYWSEAAGTDLPTLIDGLAAKGRTDVPTGEYWFWPEGHEPRQVNVADVREAASGAHTYGKPFVAAESLTTQGEEPWALGPAQLRRMTDRFFAEGVNRVILHTSVHQPFNDKFPGITLRQYGQHFTRNETWAEDAEAWVRYLARCSYLLQQGRPVADLAVYLGEDAPAATYYERPAGFDYDFINAETLLTRMEMRDGRLTLPNGVSYRAVVIPRHIRRMSPAVLRKLRELVEQGLVLVRGPRLDGALGLDDIDFKKLADELWGPGKVAPAGIGRGHLHFTLDRAVETGDLAPDVVVSGGRELHWTHRATDDADVYFISNPRPELFHGAVTLRISGRHVEAWNAVDGSRSAVTYAPQARTTEVALHLEPWGSTFLVFRGEARPGGTRAAAPDRRELLTLDGRWDVRFLDGRGAPRKVRMATGSWTNNSNPAIRYYSGRTSYATTLQVRKEWLRDQRIELDLGQVGELARVRMNGKDLGVLWNQPFRIDVTDALRTGKNRLEIVVTNYWANRLIGDEQPGATRYTFAPITPYRADAPLRPSGLLTPVRVIGVAKEAK